MPNQYNYPNINLNPNIQQNNIQFYPEFEKKPFNSQI